MNIQLNGLTNPQSIIANNGVPTILRIDSSGDGTKAKLKLTISTGGNIGEDCYLTINNITINSTSIMTNAVGNVWLRPLGLGLSYIKASAYTIAKALNNTPLANNYNIYMDNSTSTSTSVAIYLEAKEIGNQYNFSNVNTNATFITYTISAQGGSSDLLNNSKVILDIYANDNVINQSSLPFITTVEKNYYKDGVSWDISPILQSITKDGNLAQFNINASYIKNGQYNNIGSITKNYVTNGYRVNNSNLYIPNFTDMYIAQYVGRGREKATYNNTTLYYIDGSDITLSFFTLSLTSKTFTINYYDSAMNLVTTQTKTITPSQSLTDYTFTPLEGYYYVDVVTPSGTMRYNNIKPIRYANETDFHIINWRNEYGGISFVPMTFDKELETDSEITLYQKQSFDIYTSEIMELNKVYSKQIEHSVTLTSHYLDEDGRYLFYSLLHTKNAWTYLNGVKYAIIINNVSISETTTKGIYQATVEFEYSDNNI